MPRFFCENIAENKAYIQGEDAKHMTKVLRMRIGEHVTINDMNGFDYDCEVESLTDTLTTLCILKKYKNQTEPSVRITLYQCLPKGDKFDFIVQKAVELGVYKIIPVQSKFCVATSDQKSFEKKLVRYNKIAKEAAKQSGRGIIPTVENILNFRVAIEQAHDKPAIIFYEGGGSRVSNLVNADTNEISIFVGSEGGFSEEEIAYASQCNIERATLGKLILRCETASIAGVTLVLTSTRNM